MRLPGKRAGALKCMWLIKMFTVLTVLLISSLCFSQINPQYEFRGVWIATVQNIDWPSKRGLPADQQKAEFIKILDLHKRNGMNAIVMQIRPAADAFYPSEYEPWSEYLTGKQGMPPYPYYDPLQFMIEETHKRGMEFHAWINPYRAVFNVSTSSVSPSHITRLFPKLFVTYGNTKYFDPGQPEVRQHITKVVKDIVERYDLDAIHFDDYFYPYKIPGKEYPDAATYQKYGNGMRKDDWRRSNVDSIIKMLHDTIKSVNPRVKFGISPFGVWRNRAKDINGSNTKAGVTNYDDLYADILLWLQQGWIDYVAPQLYWEIGHKLCDFNTLVDWWGQHSYGRQVFIGHGIYRVVDAKGGPWKNPKELPNEINSLRSNPMIQGSVFYSSKIFNNNPNGWNDSLRNNYYKSIAIVPPMKWIDSIPPLAPLIEKVEGSDVTRIFYRGAEPIKGFIVYSISLKYDMLMENARLADFIVADKYADIDATTYREPKTRIMISAIDRNNNVSDWVELK